MFSSEFSSSVYRQRKDFANHFFPFGFAMEKRNGEGEGREGKGRDNYLDFLLDPLSGLSYERHTNLGESETNNFKKVKWFN